MLETRRSYEGMVVAPHHLAAEAGAQVLRDGGNAIEAMIAAAATIGVVYPHMNGLGGDNFWLIHLPGSKPIAIQACGRSAALATRKWYQDREQASIPGRGPLAALTVAGAVSGWQAALNISLHMARGRIPLLDLLARAHWYAREGFAVTRGQSDNTRRKWNELREVSGFAPAFAEGRKPPEPGDLFRQPNLAATLEQLARDGFDDFYTGDMAREIAKDLEAAGSPLRLADLESHEANLVMPLFKEIGGHDIYNLPPPTQGLASLLILGLFWRIRADEADSFDFVHRVVEATKRAFMVRDRHVTDPAFMIESPDNFLDNAFIARTAETIDFRRALPWPDNGTAGDTVWLAAADRHGCSVSFIQSLYWEFGSGLVLPGTGITWQNRGTSFSLEADNHNRLEPRRLPFHTIQPAMAELSDGRVLSYGTMGGEGQPQTQAAIFLRHVLYGQELQDSVTAPRWLLGRTWGDAATSLKIESRFDGRILERLIRAGHNIEMLGPFDAIVGHAGAISRHRSGLMEGAADPRSDGAAVAL